jgi:hypothetical protein
MPCSFCPRSILGLRPALSTLLSLAALTMGLSQTIHRPASTALHPLAPRELLRFDATMDALTPARRPLLAVAAGQVSSIHVPCLRDHSDSNHLMRSRIAFNSVAFSASGTAPVFQECAGLWASPFASRLAASSCRIEFAIASDWSFTSSCSPPGLAATQLLSVTGRNVRPKRTFTSLTWYTLERTSMGFQPMLALQK